MARELVAWLGKRYEHAMSPPLDHIVIYAADAAVSGRFHAVLLAELGFEKRRDHVFARDGLFIDLRQAREQGEPHRHGRPGLDHIGFRAQTPYELLRVQQALRDAGLESGRVTEFDNGDVALFVADPDGVRIELTCYADPEAEPVD